MPYVEGGAIVLTDGNLGTDFGSLLDFGYPGAVAGWWPGLSWEDAGQDPRHVAEGLTAEAALEALLSEVAARRAA